MAAIRQWWIVRTDYEIPLTAQSIQNAVEHLELGPGRIEVVEMPEADVPHFNALVDIRDDKERGSIP